MNHFSKKEIWILGKLEYRRNVEFGMLIVLTGFILFFFFFQKRSPEEIKSPEFYPVPSIEMVEIPRTVQERKINKIRPQKPVIPVPAEETEILQEVTLHQEELQLSDSFGATSGKSTKIMARQLFEVMPQKPDFPVRGQITLSLKIGIEGTVLEYRILQNTIGSNLYLQQVLEVLKKSRWQPAQINGENIESWIKKTYRIDTESTE